MKATILLSAFLFATNSFAAQTANCVLKRQSFTTKDYVNYEFVGEEVLSNLSADMIDSQIVLNDSIYPASYEVTFTEGSIIQGQLGIQIDQPGPQDNGKVHVNENLILMVEDSFNGGKDNYLLNCHLDK